MKTKIYYNITAVIVFMTIMVGFISCTKNFEEINTPPTSSVTIDPAFMFTSAQTGIVRRECSEYPNNMFGSWVQQWGGGPLFSPSRYIPEQISWVWDSYYGYLRNLSMIRNDLLKGMEEDPKGRTKLAIAKIMEIYAWQNLTDMYGPIPYSESMMPLDELIRQPKYDSQESIYKSLIADLNNAIAQLNPGDDSFEEADLFYSGDVAMWEKFGNAIKLRIGMRMKYVDNGLAKSTVEDALSSPLINSNDENADLPTFNAEAISRHPTLLQSEHGSPDYFYLAEKLVDVLVAKNDPRMPLIGDYTKTSVENGNPEYKGIKVAETEDYYSSVIRDHFSQISSKTYFNQEMEIPLHAFSYSEVCFFKAEAALEGWGGMSDADAEHWYQEGIKAAMAMQPYNIDEADIPADYITNEFSLAGLSKEEKLEKIMTQKWIMLFVRNIEAWAEWRRTGYPVLIPGPAGDGEIPRRLIYPVQESALNADSYNAAVATLSNGDTYRSKVWWDKK